ncbi:MAG: class A beta-lactamase-related serine hydrolase [Burkholderiales bacterium]|nr:MAG: class A beta-lactamase-related serine hydrolase [Burkholderiales bacterium]
MFNFIRNVVVAVAEVVYGVVNDVVNWLTGLGAALPPWTWTANSDPAAPATDTDIDDRIKTYMRQHGVKAGQFSLFVDGSLRMSSAYTWGESGYPVTQTSSVMRVASCSKAFTTAAILELLAPPAGQPVIRPDDRVFDILLPPSLDPFPLPRDPRVQDITIQHLLEHTGGWNYRTGLNALNDWVFHLKQIGRELGLSGPTEKADFARFVLCNIDLDFDPGTRPAELFTLPGNATQRMDTYSNIGYVLLGMVVDARAGSYIGFLNSRVLRSIGVTDVSVGNTRREDALPNEVRYESAYMGPDATRSPYDPRPARLPYGGDGSRKEVMDSGGGLIMSANSLARFIGTNNVFLGRLDATMLAQQKQRTNATRYGAMPGTAAAARCFQEKNGSKRYDMAIIFNKQDMSKTDRDDDSNDFERLVRNLETRVAEVF